MKTLQILVLALCAVAASSQYLSYSNVQAPSHRYRASYLPYMNMQSQTISPYSGYNIYHIGRTEPPQFPPYTIVMKDIENSINGIKSHLPFPTVNALLEEVKMPDAHTEYITLLVAITTLVDEVAKMGEEVYHRVYKTVVDDVLGQMSTNPLGGQNLIRVRTDKMVSQIAMMKDLIVQKQDTECKIPISQECDAIIDQQLELSADPLLKGEAQFFISFGSEAKLFEEEYASEFEQVAASHTAASYLRNSEDRLKLLVMAGLHARKAMPFGKIPLLRCGKCGFLRLHDENDDRQQNLN